MVRRRPSGPHLHVTDPVGTLLSSVRNAGDAAPDPNFSAHRGGAQRIDHFQILTPDVPKAARSTRKPASASANTCERHHRPARCFLQRKGHDIVFFNGADRASSLRLHPRKPTICCAPATSPATRLRFHVERGPAATGRATRCSCFRPRRPPRRAVQHALPDHGHRERADRMGPERP